MATRVIWCNGPAGGSLLFDLRFFWKIVGGNLLGQKNKKEKKETIEKRLKIDVIMIKNELFLRDLIISWLWSDDLNPGNFSQKGNNFKLTLTKLPFWEYFSSKKAQTPRISIKNFQKKSKSN